MNGAVNNRAPTHRGPASGRLPAGTGRASRPPRDSGAYHPQGLESFERAREFADKPVLRL